MLGSALYLAVDHTLYWYGDARQPWAIPHRLAADLVDAPKVLPGGLIAVVSRDADGTETAEIARLRGDAFEAIWSMPGSRVDPEVAPDVVSIPITSLRAVGYRLFVRTDGKQLLIEDPCAMVASDRQILVARCTTGTLVGKRYRQYLAAYRWPNYGSPR